MIELLIGGVIGISSAGLTQYINFKLTTKREIQNKKRENLEIFAESIFRHSDWIQQKVNTILFEFSNHNEPDPLALARVRQLLYFPELEAPLTRLSLLGQEISIYCYQQRFEQLTNREQWINGFDNQQMVLLYERMAEAQRDALERCKHIAARLGT